MSEDTQDNRSAQRSTESTSGTSSQSADAGSSGRMLGIECTCSIMVDNERIEYDISSVKLQQFINKHHVLRISIRERAEDVTRDVNSYAGVLGKSISLTIKPAGGIVDSSRSLTFVGLVTRIDRASNIDAINLTTIEAHSPTIALDGSRQNAFFRDQSHSDILGSIVRSYPITVGTLESSSGSMAYCVQHRETDFDFVMRLAGNAGLFAHYDGQEFHSLKPSSSGAEELVWRETLGSFSLGLGTAPQEFTAQVYNYEQSKSYNQNTTSVRSTASLSALSQAAPDGSKRIYAKSGFSTSPKVVADARSLDDILLRDKQRSMGRMISCSGQSSVPAITIGKCIKVRGLDDLDGHYLVDSITHEVNATGSYHNNFACRPLDIAFPSGHSAVAPSAHLQSATVVDNADPEKLGRVKVKFPWLEAEETIWIRMVTPHAGADRGWYAIPEIGDEVLVGYEFGSPRFPIVLGTLYNKDAAPPSNATVDDNNIKLFCTKGGNQIEIKDESGAEAISITTKDGENKLVLDMSGPSITIESSGDISIKGKNVVIESQEEINLTAGSNANIEASANIKNKASGTMDVEGGATVNVKGSIINLN